MRFEPFFDNIDDHENYQFTNDKKSNPYQYIKEIFHNNPPDYKSTLCDVCYYTTGIMVCQFEVDGV